MIDIHNDEYWLEKFDITQDDVTRIVNWLMEIDRGASLEELTRRVIRGRLLYGEDQSPSALPNWVHEQHVLSWDEEEKWEVGSCVFVLQSVWAAGSSHREIKPAFGIIKEITPEEFEIEYVDGGIKSYGRNANQSEASKRYNALNQAVWEKEQSAKGNRPTEEHVEATLMKHGSKIASRIVGALEWQNQFVSHNQRWYLKECLPEVSSASLKQANRAFFLSGKILSLSEIAACIPTLPTNEFADVAITQALSQNPSLFQKVEDGWQAIKPPPPPWQQALVTHYAYDPQTYEILSRPGQRLTQKQAKRLQELNIYVHVVTFSE